MKYDLIGRRKEESCLKVNLDTYDDVAKDYRFYEDPGDEFRQPPDGVSFHFYIPSQSQMTIESKMIRRENESKSDLYNKR